MFEGLTLLECYLTIFCAARTGTLAYFTGAGMSIATVRARLYL